MQNFTGDLMNKANAATHSCQKHCCITQSDPKNAIDCSIFHQGAAIPLEDWKCCRELCLSTSKGIVD